MQDSRSLAVLAEEFEHTLKSLQSTFSTSATINHTGAAAEAPPGGARAQADAANAAAAHTTALCKSMHTVLLQMEGLPRHAAAASSLRASLSAALAECSRLDGALGCAPFDCCPLQCAYC